MLCADIFSFLLRAKRKLLIVGSLEMLQHVPVLHELGLFVQERGWVVHVPCGALDRAVEETVDV